MSTSKYNNTPLIIKFHIYPKTIPPIKLGMKYTVLNNVFPLIFFDNIKAKINEITFIVIIVTIVIFIVKYKLLRNEVSIVKASI